jgi:hypothetical protein
VILPVQGQQMVQQFFGAFWFDAHAGRLLSDRVSIPILPYLFRFEKSIPRISAFLPEMEENGIDTKANH